MAGGSTPQRGRPGTLLLEGEAGGDVGKHAQLAAWEVGKHAHAQLAAWEVGKHAQA